ncbi:MAG: peroxidase-related enzyme [bacterium]
MNNQVCWIDVVGYTQADKSLKRTYDEVRNSDGSLDNLYQAFSLRPHTIRPADDLYLAVLHHDQNTLPKWYSELLGVYVAILAECEYALTHHQHNFYHLMDDPDRADNILKSLHENNLSACGNEKEVSGLAYASKLCRAPHAITREDIEKLTTHGWSDGEVLEIAQVVAMFSYFVRIINGVGISLRGDRIGLY